MWLCFAGFAVRVLGRSGRFVLFVAVCVVLLCGVSCLFGYLALASLVAVGCVGFLLFSVAWGLLAAYFSVLAGRLFFDWWFLAVVCWVVLLRSCASLGWCCVCGVFVSRGRWLHGLLLGRFLCGAVKLFWLGFWGLGGLCGFSWCVVLVVCGFSCGLWLGLCLGFCRRVGLLLGGLLTFGLVVARGCVLCFGGLRSRCACGRFGLCLGGFPCRGGGGCGGWGVRLVWL